MIIATGTLRKIRTLIVVKCATVVARHLPTDPHFTHTGVDLPSLVIEPRPSSTKDDDRNCLAIQSDVAFCSPTGQVGILFRVSLFLSYVMLVGCYVKLEHTARG